MEPGRQDTVATGQLKMNDDAGNCKGEKLQRENL